MVSRAYPGGNAPPDVQSAGRRRGTCRASATRLEGEVASHTRKLEALERRGRALRAEIGRKVEELAHEESRGAARRRPSSPRWRGSGRAFCWPSATAAQARQAADARERLGARQLRSVFERSGAARRLSRREREQLKEHEQRAAAKDAQARDLRRQIEELRAQLARYAEALEEDLATGREKVAARTREGSPSRRRSATSRPCSSTT